ncbi:MAG: aminoacyltransferase [Bacilli bacterium]|nr:aminoacyltransferase [Bacilli bacterium]
MEFKTITAKEFDSFAKKHVQASFNQTSSWGSLKKTNGWKSHYLALIEKKKIIAGTLLLSKELPLIKKNMFYAPRGFLIDYNNYEILNEFTTHVKKYAKDKNAIFIKLDPYIIYQERDIDGKVIPEEKNNKKAFHNLIKLGYQHFGFNLMQDTLQPRWLFVTDTKDKTVEEVMSKMESKTRQIIRKNERLCIKTREIDETELETFKDIMQHTGDRRQFIDRPLSYYQNMYKHLAPSHILKILLAELHTDELLNSLEKEVVECQKNYDNRKKKHDQGLNKMNENKYISKQREAENNIHRLQKKMKEVKELQAKHGKIIVLGGILFLIHGSEVVSLVGGSYEKFMEYQSAYTIHWEGCKYAIEHGYHRYNFYGITGDFNEANPLYGLYLFKKGFGGKVVELIGEFDLVISKFWYHSYHIAFKIYHSLKNLRIKNRIK